MYLTNIYLAAYKNNQECIIFLAARRNSQGTAPFSWRLFRNSQGNAPFPGGLAKQPRKTVVSLAARPNNQKKAHFPWQLIEIAKKLYFLGCLLSSPRKYYIPWRLNCDR